MNADKPDAKPQRAAHQNDQIARKAAAFDALQSMPVEEAQAYFWNYPSRRERLRAIEERSLKE